jgi:hypothetical protein
VHALEEPAEEPLPSGLGLQFDLLVGLDLSDTGDKVHLLDPDDPGLLDQLVRKVDQGEHDLREVVGDESGGKLVRLDVRKDVPGEEEQNDRDEGGGVLGGKGASVQLGVVRQGPHVDALGLHSGAAMGTSCVSPTVRSGCNSTRPAVYSLESNVEDTDTQPGQETSTSGETGKVVEHGTGVALQAHVGERAERSAEDERGPGNTVLSRLGKDLGRLSVESQSVQGSGRGVEIGRSRGPGRGEETGVDDRGQRLDTGSLDGDDEGRARGVRGSETETLEVGRDEETDDQDTTDVEDQDSDAEGQ